MVADSEGEGLDGIPADHGGGDDPKDRKRARSIVNEALRAAGTPLDNRGLRARLLPGLWQASMNVVLNCLDGDDVLRLLTDRSRGIVGEGSNADAPPRSLGERAMQSYVAEVEAAARTLMESFEEALERLTEAGMDDRFPETVLDTCLQVLLPAWGPHHVRRALAEQSALLIRGVDAPANFMEPTRLNDPAAPKAGGARAEAEQHPQPQPQSAQVLPDPPRRKRVPRRVAAYATHDVSPSGMAAWAAALVIHDESGRTERREIGGTLPDPNGRAASIAAVHECILAACEGASTAHVTLETPSEQCVRAGSDGGLPGARLPGEEHVWEAVDAASAIHSIEFRLARTSMDRDLSERCDRLVRALLGA